MGQKANRYIGRYVQKCIIDIYVSAVVADD